MAAVVAVGLLLLLVPFVSAHVGIRAETPVLPSAQAVTAAVRSSSERPVRLSWINTSSQAMPRDTVLGAGDPNPDQPYRLCHSSFVFEWSDGRILLVDTGMTRYQASGFLLLSEWVGGGPGQIHTTVRESLGAAAARVDGVIFSHLHIDHTDGAGDLCASSRDTSIEVFMSPAQRRKTNFTTKGQLETLETLDCLDLVELDPEPIAPIAGFPGVFVLAAAGHTPGSQVVAAAVGNGAERRLVVITGDIVNHIDGISLDLGKPSSYSALIVPESDEQLGKVRRLIRDLRDREGFEVLVSHDQNALEASGVDVYASAPVK